MKQFVIVLFTIACTTSSQQVPGSVKFLEQDAKVRRQGISYTTNVIHKDPKHPEQHAQSSINVDFNPRKINQQHISRPVIQQNQNQPNNLYQSYPNLQQLRRPKSQQSYTSTNNVQVLQRIPQFSQQQEKQQQTRQVYTPTNYNLPQSQSFNVGYSVSFTGSQKNQPPRAFSAAQKLENAEIITGSRKEPVRKPTAAATTATADFDSNDFVNNALIDLKKQKLSGIKPKPGKYPNSENDAKNFIGNLAPKTQQYLSYLGDAKPVGTSNIRFRQQLQPTNQKLKSTSWTNLSPSVEIYHSRELPQSHSFTPREQVEQSKHFDHAAALGKSQGFDYSNAVDESNGQAQLVPSNQEVTENIVTLDDSKVQNQIPVMFPTYYDFTKDFKPAPLVVPFTNHFDKLNVLPLQGNLQITPKSGDNQQLIQQIPIIPQHQLQQQVDMSLLHEPVLPLNGNNLPNDPHTLQIPFDTALLQAMQQKLLASAQPVDSFDASKGQVQTLQGNANVGITEQQQQYQGQVENLQVQHLQGLQQNIQDQGIINPFQQTQQTQQSQQLNIYGSPHALFLKKDFDKYFEQFYEKQAKAQESRFENISLRPPPSPKFSSSNSNNNNNSNSIRGRPLKGKEIHMNLQPPPIIKITRHRRTFL